MSGINTIEILCPPQKCTKCDKIIKSIEKMMDQEHIQAQITIVNSIDKIINRNTWILPTIIVNGKVVARGYVPSKSKLLSALNIH